MRTSNCLTVALLEPLHRFALVDFLLICHAAHMQLFSLGEVCGWCQGDWAQLEDNYLSHHCQAAGCTCTYDYCSLSLVDQSAENFQQVCLPRHKLCPTRLCHKARTFMQTL